MEFIMDNTPPSKDQPCEARTDARRLSLPGLPSSFLPLHVA